MNKIQKNRHYMMRRVGDILMKYEYAWAERPEFVEIHKEFNQRFNEISELFKLKQELSSPYGSFKLEQVDEFALQISQLAGLIQRLALKEGLTDISIYTDFSAKGFARSTAQNSITRAERIIEISGSYLEQLKKTSEGEALFKRCSDVLEEFKINVLKPSSRRKLLAEVNNRIDSIQSDSLIFLKKQFDALMRIFVDRDRFFHQEYHSARKVPKFGHTRSAKKANSEDDETIEDLENALEEVLLEDTYDSTNLPSEDTLPSEQSEAEEQSNIQVATAGRDKNLPEDHQKSA